MIFIELRTNSIIDASLREQHMNHFAHILED